MNKYIFLRRHLQECLTRDPSWFYSPRVIHQNTAPIPMRNPFVSESAWTSSDIRGPLLRPFINPHAENETSGYIQVMPLLGKPAINIGPAYMAIGPLDVSLCFLRIYQLILVGCVSFCFYCLCSRRCRQRWSRGELKGKAGYPSCELDPCPAIHLPPLRLAKSSALTRAQGSKDKEKSAGNEAVSSALPECNVAWPLAERATGLAVVAYAAFTCFDAMTKCLPSLMSKARQWSGKRVRKRTFFFFLG